MEQNILKYPIGVQNFEKLRREGYTYVDKTALVYDIAQRGSYYFLGRPRRFGKLLLLSTLHAYFEGKRELFRGLAIERMETEWKRYPVLHIDLNAADYSTREGLESILDAHLRQWEALYGRDEADRTLPLRFAAVIRRACRQTGCQVVVLVDEYDKPLTMNIDNEPLQDEMRGILKVFYGVMKSCDEYIKMGFLTGVTKFSKVSVFSDLNNIRDISALPQYVTICGITEEELRQYFDDEVGVLAEANRMTKDECYQELRRRYDGYHFCEGSAGIYNPYSIINTLANRRFDDYWFETGTPTVLVKLLKQSSYNLNDLVDGEVSGRLLASVDSLRENPVSVIYQSGYLTIKDYDREFDEYRLGFPNAEVENGFVNFLLPLYTNQQQNASQFKVSRFVKEITTGQPEAFMTRLAAMMADTDYIYILEFKLDKSADEALLQIEEKGYARPFAADPRTLYKIGINFSSAKRCVDDWRMHAG